VPIIDIVRLAKSSALEKSTEHGSGRCPIQSTRRSSVDDRKVSVRHVLEQVVNNAYSFYWAKTFYFSRHNLTRNNFVSFGNDRNLWLKERDMLEMDVDIIQACVSEDVGKQNDFRDIQKTTTNVFGK
jgi:hypothetical protein